MGPTTPATIPKSDCVSPSVLNSPARQHQVYTSTEHKCQCIHHRRRGLASTRTGTISDWFAGYQNLIRPFVPCAFIFSAFFTYANTSVRLPVGTPREVPLTLKLAAEPVLEKMRQVQ